MRALIVYGAVQISVAAAYVACLSFKRYLKASHLLLVRRLTLTGAIAFPILTGIFVEPRFTTVAIQVWSNPSMAQFHEATAPGQNADPTSSIAVTTLESAATLPAGVLAIFGLLALFVALGRIGFVIRDLLRLRWILARSHVIRRIGMIRILASDEASVPFSCWFPGRYFVVMPTRFVLDRPSFRLAALHELQHHRQGDTRLVHLWQCIAKPALYCNPFVHLWDKEASLIQEFACDDALVGRKDVSSRAYASCLLEAAKKSLGPRCLLAGTTGMASSASGQMLKRRIDMMLMYKPRQANKTVTLLIGTIALILVGTVAYASQGMIRDRRVSLEEARELARVASEETAFPIVVNESVLQELNRLVGTPDGRAFVKGALARMETHRSMVEAKIRAHGLPLELMAVPLIESGYKSVKGKRSAGLWQFIPATARRFDLRVDDKVDDRMNPRLETEAAMKYLKANHLLFQDWLLAILAYNVGESRVVKGIQTVGDRDAWKLIDAGYDNDPGYLPRMMAAVLILKNPSVVD